MAKSSVVLVHGGFVDGSGWEKVYKQLKEEGYPVTVVQNPTTSLADDVVLEMPPYATWFAGRATIGRFLAQRSFDPAAKFDNADKFRLVTTAANGQLAVAVYLRDEDALHRAHMVQVLSFAAGRISRIVAFLDPGLFPLFGLPQVCPATVVGPPAARR